jgi:7-cyano-7-deazaguanosine (preQ0) biosynthesis protein QueE
VSSTLVVSEVFGPTWQGEGPSAGRRTGFVRLGRCNLDCGWCDTPHTWDWERFDPDVELTDRPAAEVLAQLDAMAIDMVVITGGEPLLQQHRLGPLLAGAKQRGWRVEVETNGTIAPAPGPAWVDQWNVSPKLTNSGISRERRYRPEVLRAFAATGRAAFKFVVTAAGDLAEVAEIVAASGLANVWIMPEGREAGVVSARLRELAPAVLERGWNLSSRLHILLWGDARGV